MLALHTARLRLREFTLDDFDDVYAYESDAEVVQYVGYGPYSAAECRRDLQWHVAHQPTTPRYFFHLALELASNGRVIGWCGVQFDRADHHEAELGYALHRAYWGQGLMTEAARAVVHHAFSELDARRIFGECRPENVGSIRVMEKLGMKQAGCLRGNKHFKGRTWDSLIFSLIKDDWQSS